MKTLMKNTIKLGNSAGVLLPREWYGGRVKVTLLQKPVNIKKDILRILEPILEEIIGIYLTGSYSRGEQEEDSDIDILVITESINKVINVGKYHIILVSLKEAKKALEKNIITIFPLIKEAKVILNRHLLTELKNTRIGKDKLRWHIDTSKSALAIVRSLIDLEGNEIKDTAIVYSLLLRLREAYIVACLLRNKPYLTRDLVKLLSKKIDKRTIKELYEIYRAERDNKKIPKYKIAKEEINKLYNLVNEEINKQEGFLYGRKRKETQKSN